MWLMWRIRSQTMQKAVSCHTLWHIVLELAWVRPTCGDILQHHGSEYSSSSDSTNPWQCPESHDGVCLLCVSQVSRYSWYILSAGKIAANTISMSKVSKAWGYGGYPRLSLLHHTVHGNVISHVGRFQHECHASWITCFRALRKHWRSESLPPEISHSFLHLARQHRGLSRWPF